MEPKGPPPIDQQTMNHMIMQELMNFSHIKQHFGHLANHFMPQPLTAASEAQASVEPKVSQTEPKQTTENPVSSESSSKPPPDSETDTPAESKREVNINLAPEAPHFIINLPEPKVTVNVAPAPTPEINVHVDAPEKLEIPEQKTPEVNIELPANDTPKSIETIHDNFGNLSQIIKTYADGEVISTKEGNKWTIDDRRRKTR